MILDPSGQVIEVDIFESADLPGHWPRLGDFEGPGCRRVVTQANTADSDLDVSIYEIAV